MKYTDLLRNYSLTRMKRMIFRNKFQSQLHLSPKNLLVHSR